MFALLCSNNESYSYVGWETSQLWYEIILQVVFIFNHKAVKYAP
jgi:hypothetical protein